MKNYWAERLAGQPRTVLVSAKKLRELIISLELAARTLRKWGDPNDCPEPECPQPGHPVDCLSPLEIRIQKALNPK